MLDSFHRMSRILIDEVPAAKRFITAACQSWEKYKRFPLEEFINVRGAVLATSGVDLQNECFAAEGLYEMADQIRQHSLWLMHEHNPLVPPLGRVLAAKAFYSPESRLHFVAGVLGLYDPSKYPSFSSVGWHVGMPLAELSAPELGDANWEKTIALSYNPHEIPPLMIEQLLQERPPEVAPQPALVGRKAADPLTILALSTSLWVLTSNPFTKKFSERLGERAADTAIELSSWLKDRVVAAFSGLDVMKCAYAHAIARRYRFYSYGDACLLFRSRQSFGP